MKTEKDLKSLIDADILQYRCGFAADAQVKRDLKLQYPDASDEDLLGMMEEMDYKAIALHNVKSVLEYVVDRFNPEYRLYIQGEGNYRHDVATIQEYKGNRKESRRPKYYDDIKQYCIDHWNAIIVNHKETDDAIGIEQFDNPDKYTVIVSIDKDMDTIPGWHFNWVKDELYYVTVKDANLFFFRQMLEGDRVDNIPGIKGIGVKKVDALMEACGRDVDKVREAVKDLYRKQYGEEWERCYREVGTLLYILRDPSHHPDNKGCPLL